MSRLERLDSPADLRGLDDDQLRELAGEIRGFLVEKVSRTGGHLGPNLGVVELTLALHRVFDSPKDPIVFDTGHQAYVHKLVTGRRDGFDTLRQKGGLSGYPSRAESPHDVVESSHASASLSYADGLAKAFALRGESHRHVVAVVGDGALTGGMCWEALNNIAASDRPLVLVVNDNGRSYSPTIGGLAEHLDALRTEPMYEKAMSRTKRLLTRKRTGLGRFVYNVLHGIKTGLKDAVAPEAMFTDLGIKYIGPVDGHDQRALENALRSAKGFGRPVIVHVVTRKGMGYAHAENDEADQMHSTGVIDPETGRSAGVKKRDWTAVFSEALVEHGGRRDDLVAITAAMAGPTGMVPFAERFPERFFDVGIAEQHAVTSAAGLALGGMRPVVAIYSTFLNRAFDQALMDVALLGQPVTFVLDRAGLTGSDGASHNGMWDLSLLGIIPGLRVAAPRDEPTLREEFAEALAISDGPTALRFPKGTVIAAIPALERTAGGVDIVYRGATPGGAQVLIVAVGSLVGAAVAAAELLAAQGVTATVVDPRWVLPVSADIISLSADHELVVTVEDNGVHGGVGSAIGAALSAAEVDVPVRHQAVPQRFLDHATRDELLTELDLTAGAIARSVTGWFSTLDEVVRGGPEHLPAE